MVSQYVHVGTPRVPWLARVRGSTSPDREFNVAESRFFFWLSLLHGRYTRCDVDVDVKRRQGRDVEREKMKMLEEGEETVEKEEEEVEEENTSGEERRRGN